MLTTFVVSEPELTLKLDGITIRLLEVDDRFELQNFKFDAFIHQKITNSNKISNSSLLITVCYS